MNKRARIVYMAVFAFSSICALAADNIISRPVGVSTINIPAQSRELASLPYIPFVPALDSVIGGQVTNGVGLVLWNNLLQKYEQADWVNGRWQQVSTTDEVSIVAGDAFWVVNWQSTNQTLLLGGEVNLAASNTTMLLPGMNLIGLPQSAGVAVENSGLAKLGIDRLTDARGNAVINMVPGEGYWYSRHEEGCRAWVEVFPPVAARLLEPSASEATLLQRDGDLFPAEGSLPAITGLQTTDSGLETPSVRLSIALSGNCRKIDIYYKDQVATEPLALDKGWLIAEADLPVRGKTMLEWIDTSSNLQSVVCSLKSSSRYYLVGNADVDLDKDGVPDCRKRFVMEKGFTPAAQQSSSSGLSVPSVVKSAPVLRRLIYVDCKNGSDRLTGKAPVAAGSDGPKQTIKGGFGIVNNGETVVVKQGEYSERVVVPSGVLVICEGRVTIN